MDYDEFLGRIVVDIKGILSGDESANILVQNGDTLHVPKFSPTIAVVGEVYEPGTFRYRGNQSIEDYIEMAGGSTTYALTKNTYLLKANGSVMFTKDKLRNRLLRFENESRTRIQAGDVVVVPPDLDYETTLNRVSSITSVVFRVSSIAFLSITNN